MNDHTSSPNSASSADLPPRAELDQLLGHAEQHAQQVLRTEGRLQPTLFAVSTAGLFMYAPGPLNEVTEKNEFAAAARLICVAQDAVAAVLALEAWVLEARPGQRLDLTMRPSLSPHRQEYICLNGQARGGLREQILLPMRRDRRGRFSCLGTKTVLHDPADGRFANLLPPFRPTDEIRAFAASMLQLRGLRITTVPIQGSPGAAFPA